LDGVALAASEPGSGVRSLKIRRTVSLVESRIEGYRFVLQGAKRNMARDRLKCIRLPEPVVWESGTKTTEYGNLGQSVAVLKRM